MATDVACGAADADGKKKLNYTLMRGKRYNAVLYAAENGHMYTSKYELYLK